MPRYLKNKHKVALLKCTEYTSPFLKRKINTLLKAISYTVPTGAKILLKPNLVIGRSPNNNLACTNGQFIAAVAEWFLDHGSSVAVGDSPAFGGARQVMEANGIAAILNPHTIWPFLALLYLPPLSPSASTVKVFWQMALKR